MSPSRSRPTHPGEAILRTMERIYRYRMTTTSGGNLSIREPNGDIWITPAGVDKGSLRAGDIVCVHGDGRVGGPHPPSSEFPFHRAIYQARPDLGGIVHAHPVALVAFSITGRVPDTRLFHQARRVCGEAGLAAYALPGSEALGRNIAGRFAKGFSCVLLENHGVVTGGASLSEAFERFETLEFTAKTIIKAGQLGEVRYLTDDQISLAHRHLTPLPGREPGKATPEQNGLRRQLCEFVRRSYQQRLFISTGGSFSARLDRESFLITPTDVDRHELEPDDIVSVRWGGSEPDKRPSRAARLHQAIYARHPDVGAVLNAFPVNATAFGVTGVPLETRTIPESYVVLRDARRLPFGPQFGNPESVADAVNLRQPVVLLENDGVLAVGRTILEAFDRLEVIESTAEALINARLLGQVRPMDDAAIAELKRAFLG